MTIRMVDKGKSSTVQYNIGKRTGENAWSCAAGWKLQRKEKACRSRRGEEVGLRWALAIGRAKRVEVSTFTVRMSARGLFWEPATSLDWDVA